MVFSVAVQSVSYDDEDSAVPRITLLLTPDPITDTEDDNYYTKSRVVVLSKQSSGNFTEIDKYSLPNKDDTSFSFLAHESNNIYKILLENMNTNTLVRCVSTDFTLYRPSTRPEILENSQDNVLQLTGFKLMVDDNLDGAVIVEGTKHAMFDIVKASGNDCLDTKEGDLVEGTSQLYGICDLEINTTYLTSVYFTYRIGNVDYTSKSSVEKSFATTEKPSKPLNLGINYIQNTDFPRTYWDNSTEATGFNLNYSPPNNLDNDCGDITTYYNIRYRPVNGSYVLYSDDNTNTYIDITADFTYGTVYEFNVQAYVIKDDDTVVEGLWSDSVFAPFLGKPNKISGLIVVDETGDSGYCDNVTHIHDPNRDGVKVRWDSPTLKGWEKLDLEIQINNGSSISLCSSDTEYPITLTDNDYGTTYEVKLRYKVQFNMGDNDHLYDLNYTGMPFQIPYSETLRFVPVQTPTIPTVTVDTIPCADAKSSPANTLTSARVSWTINKGGLSDTVNYIITATPYLATLSDNTPNVSGGFGTPISSGPLTNVLEYTFANLPSGAWYKFSVDANLACGGLSLNANSYNDKISVRVSSAVRDFDVTYAYEDTYSFPYTNNATAVTSLPSNPDTFTLPSGIDTDVVLKATSPQYPGYGWYFDNNIYKKSPFFNLTIDNHDDENLDDNHSLFTESGYLYELNSVEDSETIDFNVISKLHPTTEYECESASNTVSILQVKVPNNVTDVHLERVDNTTDNSQLIVEWDTNNNENVQYEIFLKNVTDSTVTFIQSVSSNSYTFTPDPDITIGKEYVCYVRPFNKQNTTAYIGNISKSNVYYHWNFPTIVIPTLNVEQYRPTTHQISNPSNFEPNTLSLGNVVYTPNNVTFKKYRISVKSVTQGNQPDPEDWDDDDGWTLKPETNSEIYNYLVALLGKYKIRIQATYTEPNRPSVDLTVVSNSIVLYNCHDPDIVSLNFTNRTITADLRNNWAPINNYAAFIVPADYRTNTNANSDDLYKLGDITTPQLGTNNVTEFNLTVIFNVNIHSCSLLVSNLAGMGYSYANDV